MPLVAGMKPDKNPHRRAFARAVWAEQADDFAARDRERNAVHGRPARIALRQIGHFNHHFLGKLAHQNLKTPLPANKISNRLH